MRLPVTPRRPRLAVGFTLVEILVVIAIISVLAGLTYAIYPAATERGRTAACISNLRQIGIALIAYAEDNDGLSPPYATNRVPWPGPPWFSSQGLVKGLQAYLGDNSLWFCPSDPYAGRDDWTWGIWHEWTSYRVKFGNGPPPWPYPLPAGWKPSTGGEPDLPAGKLYSVAWDANTIPGWGGQHRGRFNMLYWDGHVGSYHVRQDLPWEQPD